MVDLDAVGVCPSVDDDLIGGRRAAESDYGALDTSRPARSAQGNTVVLPCLFLSSVLYLFYMDGFVIRDTHKLITRLQ